MPSFAGSRKRLTPWVSQPTWRRSYSLSGGGDEAIAILEAAHRFDPHYQPVHENLLTAGLNLASQSPRAIAQRHFRWGGLFPAASLPPLGTKPDRLRVGYLSANFGFNPEIFFTLPLLEAHDRSPLRDLLLLRGCSRLLDCPYQRAIRPLE